MDNFPPDVLLNIFSRLPVTSQLKVKLVCQQWRKLVQDPLLLNLLCSDMIDNDRCLILHDVHPAKNQIYAMYHYRHDGNIGMVRNIQVPIIDEFDVAGSCNGLLCLLPRATLCADKYSTEFGFGVSPSGKEYKLVKITRNSNQTRWGYLTVTAPSSVEILTLGTSSWRSLGQTPYFPAASASQVLVNGRLHWVNTLRRHLVSFLTVNKF